MSFYLSNYYVSPKNEVFKKIPNTEYYWISKNGKVLSTKRGKKRILSATDNGCGYLRVCVYGGNRRDLIGRLVLTAWVRPPRGNE